MDADVQYRQLTSGASGSRSSCSGRSTLRWHERFGRKLSRRAFSLPHSYQAIVICALLVTVFGLGLVIGSKTHFRILATEDFALHPATVSGQSEEGTGRDNGRQDISEPLEDPLSSQEDLRTYIAVLQREIVSLKKHQVSRCVHEQTRFLKQPGVFSNEYELNPYSFFTAKRFYPASLALGKRVVEKPIGSKRKAINEVVGQGIRLLNEMRSNGRVAPRLAQLFNSSQSLGLEDFVEGITSSDPLHGTHYHLYFRTALAEAHGAVATGHQRTKKSYHKLTFLRPLGQPVLVSNEVVSTERETVHLIVPVSEERLDSLAFFLANIGRLEAEERQARKLKIYVAYYGNVKSLYERIDKKLVSRILQISPSSSAFSRAKGLEAGASIACREHSNSTSGSESSSSSPSSSRAKSKSSCLLFFCDIDVVFTSSFLERCRLHASRGRKVYYPIVFSLYNPKFSKISWTSAPSKTSYSTFSATAANDSSPHRQPEPLPLNLHKLISKETGFWRDFGFGMTCQYQSDFEGVGGFEDYLAMTGQEGPDDYSDGGGGGSGPSSSSSAGEAAFQSSWGGEDVLLYRKQLQSPDLSVIRSVDPGIFHLWHQKDCDKAQFRTSQQLQSCLSSKSLNEASQLQLALALAELERAKTGQEEDIVTADETT